MKSGSLRPLFGTAHRFTDLLGPSVLCDGATPKAEEESAPGPELTLSLKRLTDGRRATYSLSYHHDSSRYLSLNANS